MKKINSREDKDSHDGCFAKGEHDDRSEGPTWSTRPRRMCRGNDPVVWCFAVLHRFQIWD